MRVLFLSLLVVTAAFAGCAATEDTSNPRSPTNATSATGEKLPMTATIDLGENNPGGVPLPGQTGAGMSLTAKGMDALIVGRPVNLTITNKGMDVHDVVIPDLAFKSGDIPGGKSVTMTFTPSKAGTFDMYCDKGQAPFDHRAAGMNGKVTVKAA